MTYAFSDTLEVSSDGIKLAGIHGGPFTRLPFAFGMGNLFETNQKRSLATWHSGCRQTMLLASLNHDDVISKPRLHSLNRGAVHGAGRELESHLFECRVQVPFRLPT
jgi:hypothetical protein